MYFCNKFGCLYIVIKWKLIENMLHHRRPGEAVQSSLPSEYGVADSVHGVRPLSSPDGLDKRPRRLSHKYEEFEQAAVVNTLF